MQLESLFKVVAFYVVLGTLVPILGSYMARVFEGQENALYFLKPFERFLLKIIGIHNPKPMEWKKYALQILAFNGLGFLFLLLILLLQPWLPLNPTKAEALPFWTAFNIAASFVTNTNWQSYIPETALSIFSQTFGLAVQNFLSAATGFCVFAAVVRGLRSKEATHVGHFWVDLNRSLVYILLPLSLVWSLMLVSQGVIQNFNEPQIHKTLAGHEQTIPTGPVASQIAIKQLGTNGGGYFTANSAHPFENPTPFSNFLQLIAILLLPASLCYTFGKMVGSLKQGYAILAAMTVMFTISLSLGLFFESSVNPAVGTVFMEGKETRLGVTDSTIWTAATTAASNGSANAALASVSPMTALMALFNMIVGEVIFGGVGAGIYGMLMFVILAVFLSGLMVGRTPEYLGKKVEANEVRLAAFAVLIPCALTLGGTALALMTEAGRAGLSTGGPQGLTEVLYAFASASNNNGSAFASLSANSSFYNITLGLCLLIGRYVVIFAALAIAGSLAEKRFVPASSGTMPTDNSLFVFLLIAVILIVGALTYLPVLSLGPLAQHFIMMGGG